MTPFTLPATTAIAGVTLRVADLDRALRFYADDVGLKAHIDPGGAHLSADDGAPILHLIEDRAAVPRPPRSTGLYHHAIRLPSRAALARLLRRLIERGTRFQGFSDHTVSEAIYLLDPDGLGVELYRDRPREDWRMAADGHDVDMLTTALDVQDLLAAAAGPWDGLDPGTDMGHVHLHVSDLRRAEAFYTGLLGFTVMQRNYPGALFVAAGGYHHHIGLNTWAGPLPPPPSAVGLAAVHIAVPNADGAADTLFERVRAEGRASGRAVGTLDGGLSVADDDSNRIELRAV